MRLGCQYLPGTYSSLLQNTVTVLWHWSLLAIACISLYFPHSLSLPISLSLTGEKVCEHVFPGQRERRGGRKIEKEGGNLSWIVIFHERSIKNRHKLFSPSGIQIDEGRVSVCLSVCLSALFKNVNNFWRNERMLLKFSGLVQFRRSNFWAGE